MAAIQKITYVHELQPKKTNLNNKPCVVHTNFRETYKEVIYNWLHTISKYKAIGFAKGWRNLPSPVSATKYITFMEACRDIYPLNFSGNWASKPPTKIMLVN